MKKSDRFQSFSKSSFKVDRTPALRKLGVENLEERQLLSASTLAEAAAIGELTSDSAIVAQQDAFAPIDLSNAVGEEMRALFVTTQNDVVDPTDGVISLREAVDYAREDPSLGNTITFASYVSEITLHPTPIDLDFSVNIGNDNTHVNVSCESSVFVVYGDVDVNLNGISMSDVKASHGSLKITDGARVVVKNATFAGNETELGGAIYVDSGDLTVYNSKFINNKAQYGAGIFIAKACNVEIFNSLLVENTSANGVIWAYGDVENSPSIHLINTTVANNECGLDLEGNRVTLVMENSVVVNNGVGDRLNSVVGEAHNSIFTEMQSYTVDSEFSVTPLADGFYDFYEESLLLKDDYTLNTLQDFVRTYVVDGGVNQYVPSEVTKDIAGNERFVNTVDLGAFEVPLETRSLVVTTETDVVSEYDGLISLREAVAYAKADPSLGNTITFAPNVSTVTLTQSLIDVDFSLNIGDDNTNVTVDCYSRSSAFNVFGNGINVTFNGVSIRKGSAPALGDRTNGVLKIADGANVTVKRGTFSENYSVQGGVIRVLDSNLTVYDSKFINNNGTPVYGANSNVEIHNSLLAENQSIALFGNLGVSWFLYNVTVANNEGAGISVNRDNILNMYNSIVVNNGRTSSLAGVAGVVSNTIFTEMQDDSLSLQITPFPQEFYEEYDESALLKADYTLNTNEDFVNTYVVDGGSNQYVSSEVTKDLAGNPRIFHNVVDLGAFEALIPAETPSLVVTTETDVVDAYDGLISLREAVAYAKADATLGDTITFASNVSTVTLASDYITVDFSVNIGDDATNVTIDCNQKYGAFYATGSVDVTFNGVSFTNAYSFQTDQTNGALCVANHANVTVKNATFRQNQGPRGAAILFTGGNLTVYCSRFLNNGASNGSAIFFAGDGVAEIHNSLVAENDGAAIRVLNGNLNLFNATIANNNSAGLAFNGDGALNMYNSVVVKNYGDDFSSVGGEARNSIFTGMENFTPESSFSVTPFAPTFYEVYHESLLLNDDYALNADQDFVRTYVVDGGNNEYVSSEVTTDLAGNPRIFNGVVDIGAYEAQTLPSETPSIIVTTESDVVDPTDGLISLREAVEVYFAYEERAFDANVDPTGKTVTFSAEVGASGVRVDDGEITISESMTILGAGATSINAHLHSRIFKVADGVGSVVFEELRLVNGVSIGVESYASGDAYDATMEAFNGGAIYAGATAITVKNSTFANNAGYIGGAIFVNGGTLTVENSTFDENAAGYQGGAIAAYAADGATTLTITGSDFVGNASDRAGAIYFKDGTASISGASFDNNRAVSTNGGAITFANATATLTDVAMTKNTATRFGGALFAGNSTVTIKKVKNVTINENDAEYGGAIYGSKSTLTVAGSFANNTAKVSGGAIFSGADVKVAQATFKENTAKVSGGAIYAIGALEDAASTFRANSAKSGGAVYATKGAVNITGSTFTRNSSDGSGGAIRMAKSSSATINYATFTSNTAKSVGGAIAIGATTTAIFVGNEFTSNAATNSGGAIYATSVATINSSDATFYGNTTSKFGGAIAAVNGTNLTVLGGEIKSGSALAGGAIYVADGATRIRNSATISGNTATAYGAGVYGVASDITVNGSTLTGNTATGSGGAIFASQGSVELVDATVTENKSTKGAGGAISVSAADLFSVLDATLTGNSAKNSGGAIYAQQTRVEIRSGLTTRTTVSNNSSQKFGGAIYVASNELEVGSVDFTGNGGSAGGAIFATSGNVTLTGATFTENTATERGGAIFAANGAATLTNTTFERNTATKDAGAAYFNGVIATLVGGAFTVNTATERGGAIFQVGGTTTVEAVQFVGNIAKNVGGAFYQLLGVSTITDSTFTTNTALTKKAGALYVGKGATTINDSTFTGNLAPRGTAIAAIDAVIVIDDIPFPVSGAIEEALLPSAVLDDAFAELFVEELD